MLEISLILANRDPIYQDMASKFFEHYVAIIDAMNNISELGELMVPNFQGSHKLWKSWKTWKITKKSSMHGKIIGI